MREALDEAVGAEGPDDAHRRDWALFRRQFDLVRSSDRVTYLTRWWIVSTPWFGVALHRMTAEDARDTLHDHPWGFLSIILRGGYTERRLRPLDRTVDEAHHVRRFNRMRLWDAHAIIGLDRTPTWTLMFVGRKVRKWGFWEKRHDGHGSGIYWTWTPHDAYDTGHYVP